MKDDISSMLLLFIYDLFRVFYSVTETKFWDETTVIHYNDIMKGTMASQITSLTIVHSTVYSGTDQRKHQSFVLPVNSPHKWTVTRKMFPFYDVIIWNMSTTYTKIWPMYYIPGNMHTVPGLSCFVVVCYWLIVPISIRVTSLFDCPSANKVTLINMRNG